MNMMKKVLAVVLSVLVIASFASVGMTASAEGEEAISGIRWFPVPENRQNDEAWEVECIADGCLCQRFNDEENTGYRNYLDTTYSAEGALTISRNDATITVGDIDYTEANYWPRIRTISLETSPELDLKTANTFYFDFVAHEGTQWNVMLAINGINVKLSQIISDACGVAGVANSDADGVAGAYKGSFNIQEAIEKISKESGTESATNAMALKNMKKTFVPQLHIFCVGGQNASITINEMYISTPEDTAGENCTFVDMGLLTGFGDEWYELETDEPVDEPIDEPIDEPVDEPVDEPDTTTTTTAAAEKESGGNFFTWLFNLLFGWLF